MLIFILIALGVIVFFIFRKSRKAGVIVSASLASLALLAGVLFARGYFFSPAIGIISGAEHDRVTIDGVRYEECANSFSASDKGAYLGRAETADHEINFRIYTVKNSDGYIYRLWDHDGAFLKRIN